MRSALAPSTVFIVDDGWIRYDLETRARGAGGERVTILPPNVVHDGRAAGAGGFRKRVLYIFSRHFKRHVGTPPGRYAAP